MQFCRITCIGHRRESRALANNRLDIEYEESNQRVISGDKCLELL